MSRMTKADFLVCLAIAVDRMKKGVESKASDAITRMSGNRAGIAEAHAKDMGIFIPDPEFPATLDNPVVKAIEWLSSFQSGEPLSLYQIASIEAAWEYFHKKELQNVPYLYWDRMTNKWSLSESPDWNSHNFVFFSHD